MSATEENITSNLTLLTEHLTYRPTALIDDIVNSINILAFKATEAVERGLLAADPSDLGFRIPPQHTTKGKETTEVIAEKAKNEIENGVHQLETLLEAKIDKNFDRLEIYALRNILNVPTAVQDWIRLSHHDSFNFSSNNDTPNTETISTLRKKLRETQKLHAFLRAESTRNQATISAMKCLILKKEQNCSIAEQQSSKIYPAFAFLENKGDLTGDVKRPVTTSASFVLSQLPILKAFLENLQPRLNQLSEIKDGRGNMSEQQKQWNQERFEFIERETRKYLEIVQGLELGYQGALKDEQWQGEGREIQKEGLLDLEKIVQEIINPSVKKADINVRNEEENQN
ncbi:putative mis12 domain-containing protein [Erysiphe necator]|uniref:Putative mis12 domain-containing protein n=1 Tax=Uncinula necator TaxID=52586 RepID=A0A0B1P0J5_UNCNE|nr:putative mis12 domain-containing protein [Erysiphe necator]